MDIKFYDFARANESYIEEFTTSLNSFIKGGNYILGPEVELFEREFAKYCGTKYCIGVANGMDALQLVLMAWGIGPGDEVIVPSNTFIATWLAVSMTGAVPVPVEPELLSMNIDLSKIEAAVTKKTKAIIPVHLFGRLVDMQGIMSLAKRFNLKVLEDSAQAHGAYFSYGRAGGLGNASAFSFYPGKNLGAIGDGGAITTNDDVLCERVKALRNYGSKVKYKNEIKGINSRLDEIQATFLRIKLRNLDFNNQKRINIANKYIAAFEGLPMILPQKNLGNESVWHQFVIRAPNRDLLQSRIAKNRVQTIIHYPIPPHRQGAYIDSYRGPPLKITEDMSSQSLSLPIAPYLSDDEVDFVINAVRKSLI